MIRTFAHTARGRLRLENGGYLRALARRVEVADKEVRVMGTKSGLLRTLVAASSGESAAGGVHSSVPKWRASVDETDNYISAGAL